MGQLDEKLLSGGTALAGLLLVFLGSVVSSFSSFAKADQAAVVSAYRRRVWLAFLGFVAAALAAVTGLAADRLPGWTQGLGFWLLIVSLALGVLLGLLLVLEIK